MNRLPRPEDYTFRFGDYISSGFRIIFTRPWLFAGFTLLGILFGMILSIVPFVGDLASTFILTPILSAGIMYVSEKIENREPVEFNDFFKGFDKINNFVIYGLISAGFLAAGFWFVFGAFSFESLVTSGFSGGFTFDPENFPWWSLIVFIPLVYLYIAWSFAVPYIMFYDVQAWEAMEASRKLISRHWFLFLLFCFIIGILATLGVIGLGIGILFTGSLTSTALYAAFRDIVGRENADLTPVDHFIVD